MAAKKIARKPIRRKRTLTHDFVTSCLTYRKTTGKFYWRDRADVTPNVRARDAHREAGCKTDGWYTVIRIGGHLVLAHIIAWFIVTGQWPKDEIDHRNGRKGDNRFRNLREATATQNRGNSRITSRNTSGIKGVFWHKSRKRWCAAIGQNRKTIVIGFFTRKSEAGRAYRREAARIFGDFARHC